MTCLGHSFPQVFRNKGLSLKVINRNTIKSLELNTRFSASFFSKASGFLCRANSYSVALISTVHIVQEFLLFFGSSGGSVLLTK